MIRGISYLTTNHLTSNNLRCSELVNKGLNTFFLFDNRLFTDYTACENSVKQLINTFEPLNVELWLGCAAFTNTSGTQTDPTNTENNQLLFNRVEQMLTDYPEIKGISLNDYGYTEEYYLWNSSEQQTFLASFVGDLKDHINSYGGFLGTCLLPWTWTNARIDLISPNVDLVQMELYRLPPYFIPTGTSEKDSFLLFKQKLRTCLSLVGNTDMMTWILGFGNCYENGVCSGSLDVQYSMSQMRSDINSVLKSDCVGYGFCDLRWVINDIYFPMNSMRSNIINSRKVVTNRRLR